MSDGNATELLRELLDERGVEWADQFGPFPVTAYEGNGVTWIAKEYTAGKFSIETRPVTPEQAVAATLGSEREKALEEPVQEQANSNALRVCPFCGGEAEIRTRKVHHSDWFGKNYRTMYRARCKSCGATVGKLAACEYHRDERTGREWGAIVDWNARAERTCELYRDEFGVWNCKACGEALDSWYDSWAPNYCPNCGAKVTKSDQDL